MSGRSAVAIGTFDGVHRAVLAAARAAAQGLGAETVALTFTPHPAEVLRPDLGPVPWITPPPVRRALLVRCGADRVEELSFDRELAAVEAEAFVRHWLVERLGAVHVAVGEGFRFGHGGRGNAALLERLGRDLGFGLTVVPPVREAGAPVSSTRIRTALALGDLEGVRRMLGRSPGLVGRVTVGARRGRLLGFPTANLALPEGQVLPPDGVYAVRVVVDGMGDRLPGACSLGRRPMFDGPGLCEVHLLDFDGDLYGRELEVQFVQFLRPSRDFGTLSRLAQAIREDVAAVRRLLDGAADGVVS